MISIRVKRSCVPMLAVAVLIFCQSCKNPAEPAQAGLEFTLQGPATQSVTVGGEAVFEFLVKNRGPSKAVVRCVKRNISLPDTLWETSFCFGRYCVTPEVDSTEFPSIEAGASEWASLHFNTFRTVGSGQTKFTMYSVNDPTQKFEQTFTCIATQ